MTGNPVCVGFISARGGGSTFYRKNAYPLLDRPVIAWAIDIMQRAGFMEQIYVWTEDRDLSEIAREAGAVPLKRPRAMVHYYAGWGLGEWYRLQDEQIKEHLGKQYNYILPFNCNCIGFRPESLRDMYQLLLDVGNEGFRIQAISPVPGGFCLEASEQRLFPFWNDVDKPLGKGLPPLYRIVGGTIVHCTRANTGEATTLFYKVSEQEGLDFQSPDDIPFAEFYLSLNKNDYRGEQK